MPDSPELLAELDAPLDPATVVEPYPEALGAEQHRTIMVDVARARRRCHALCLGWGCASGPGITARRQCLVDRCPSMSSVIAVSRKARAVLAAFDPASLSGGECADVVEELAVLERACAAARVRAASRAAGCGEHRARGFVEEVEWLSRVSGSSTAEARSALGAVRALEGCPQAREALRAGELSSAQAAVIAGTAEDAPGCEADLVVFARRASLRALADEARRVRAAAIGPGGLHGRRRRARRFRSWRDELGMVAFRGALPPEVGVPFLNRIDREARRLADAARGSAEREPFEAYAADALGALVLADAPGSKPSPRADVVVVVDLRAWRRGRAEPGEPVHVVGGGPIPVAVARQLAADGFLKAVLHDGTAVHTVAHFGRHIPARLRTALDLGPPPHFEGVVCAEPGCERRLGLEWDHVDPLAHGGPTSLDNLQPRCWAHHRDKTRRDRQAGLLAGAPAGPDPP